jgi:hypothetical protein
VKVFEIKDMEKESRKLFATPLNIIGFKNKSFDIIEVVTRKWYNGGKEGCWFCL